MVPRALLLVLLLAPLPASARWISKKEATYAAGGPIRPGTVYVSPSGSDDWTGALPSPNKDRSDGPLKTLPRALNVFRVLPTRGPRRILLSGGTHFLAQPLVLEAGDSNLEIAAFPNEKPILSGGRAITGWKKAGPNFEAGIPDAPKNWYFRRLRAGDGDAARWQIPARFPNFNAKNPIKGGWSFVARPTHRAGVFGGGLGSIHTPGDWFEWKINVPTPGDYTVWSYYAAFNAPFGHASMAGRTQLQIDGGAPQVLGGLEDTGDWSRKAWSRGAMLRLQAGEHALRWTNVQGGGLNLDAFALALDPGWTPPENPSSSTRIARPAPSPVIEVQAESFSARQSKQGIVDWGSAPEATTLFEFKAGDVRSYQNLDGAEINIFPGLGWVSSVLPIEKIDLATRQVLVAPSRNSSEEIRPGNRFTVSHVREELDAPGEWFYDSRRQVLAWRPHQPGAQNQAVVAPLLDHLIELRGASNISLRNLEFNDTTAAREVASVYEPSDAAIWMAGARGCVIEGCRFRWLGGYALKMSEGASHNELVGNEVGPVGEGGVILSGATATQPRDNTIEGNWMRDLGALWKHVAGVYCSPWRAVKVLAHEPLATPHP